MKKTTLVLISSLWLVFNIWGSVPDDQKTSSEYVALNEIVRTAQTKKSAANQNFIATVLFPRQQKLLALYARTNKVCADLFPSYWQLGLLRFAALFHSEAKATLKELRILSKPYVDILTNLESSIKANRDLIAAILKSDASLFLAPPAPKQNLDISTPLIKTCEDFFYGIVAENITFYAQRKVELEEYHKALKNFSTQRNSPTRDAVQRELALVSAEIENFTVLLRNISSTPNQPKKN